MFGKMFQRHFLGKLFEMFQRCIILSEMETCSFFLFKYTVSCLKYFGAKANDFFTF